MDYHKQASDAAAREDWSAVEQALMEMVEGVPTDLTEPYRLPVEASTEENIEELERYYQEYVGSPFSGAESALAFEQYALEEGDREQFEEFRAVLGGDAPESLEKFLDLKYNDSEKWDALKIMKRQTAFVKSAPCVTTPKKYTGYFLKMGAKHADQFFSVGYTQDNPLQLRYDMAMQFDMEKAEDIEDLGGGARKFNIYMELGVTKKRRFYTGWIQVTPDSPPRIVTGFRKSKGKRR